MPTQAPSVLVTCVPDQTTCLSNLGTSLLSITPTFNQWEEIKMKEEGISLLLQGMSQKLHRLPQFVSHWQALVMQPHPGAKETRKYRLQLGDHVPNQPSITCKKVCYAG